MNAWPKHPVIYEINTWVWLQELSQKYKSPITLAKVPREEWDFIADLKVERNDLKGAEKHLKAALKADPQMAQAAYNLCVITAKDRLNEAVTWCRKATELRPQEPRYCYTLAFYLHQMGERDEAIRTLKTLTEKYPGYKDAEMLLEEISKTQKRP